jgi:hypothetical protein
MSAWASDSAARTIETAFGDRCSAICVCATEEMQILVRQSTQLRSYPEQLSHIYLSDRLMQYQNHHLTHFGR